MDDKKRKIKNVMIFVLGALFLMGSLIPFFLPEESKPDPLLIQNLTDFEYLDLIKKFNITPVTGDCDGMMVDRNHLVYAKEKNDSFCISWDKRELDYYYTCVEKNGSEVIDHCGSLSVPIK